ncbi:MAG TPA: hypothetical protein VGM90_22390 [Kofleriaceae bacterium]
MKRALVIGAALLLVSTAVAGPKTKKAPDRFGEAASEAFVAAEAADAKNDPATALGLYTKAFEISPHSATAYNLGDVERRANHISEAINWYEMYLLLAPNAADAKEVTALITKLVATPIVLRVLTSPLSSAESLDLGRAYILFDGDVVKRGDQPVALGEHNEPMIDLDAPSRDLVLDVVTPLSFKRRVCDFERRRDKHECLIAGKPREDGSVVIDTNARELGVEEPGYRAPSIIGKRTKLAPGKHRLMITDRNIECQTLTIDVPTNNDVAFVFLRAEKTDFRERCRDIEVIQRRLTFK